MRAEEGSRHEDGKNKKKMKTRMRVQDEAEEEEEMQHKTRDRRSKTMPCVSFLSHYAPSSRKDNSIPSLGMHHPSLISFVGRKKRGRGQAFDILSHTHSLP